MRVGLRMSQQEACNTGDAAAYKLLLLMCSFQQKHQTKTHSCRLQIAY
jgi:hypothetical protein